MSLLQSEATQILRRLRQTPAFTIVTLLTVALGVGASATMFGLVESVLLKPLPYSHPEQLIAVWHTAPGIGVDQLDASPSTYLTYRDHNRTFSDIGLWTGDSVSVTGIAQPEQVDALDVTERTLPLLGINPVLGRTFNRKDDTFGSPATVMLTYGYWQHKFGGSRSVIGRRLLVDGGAREVIGVLPKKFRFMDQHPVLVLPFQFDTSKMFLGNFSYRCVARLKPGVPIAQASADVARMLTVVNRTYPAPPGYSLRQFQEARIGPKLISLDQDVIGDIGKVLWVLMGTISIVLLIACANVANLLLVRAEGRQQELAIRSALGASWVRIARILLTESLAFGLLGGALGLAFALGALRLLVSLAPANLPRLDDIGIDTQVILFTFLISLVAGLLFGSFPVLKYAGTRVGFGLRQGGRNASQSRERHRARSTLVVVQIALALVLLISSGLMMRTIHALTLVHPGFSDPKSIQILQISIPEAQVKNPERVVRMQEDMLNGIRSIHDVSSVALTSSIPMDGSSNFDPVFAQDQTYTEKQVPLHRYEFISPGYFKTLGVSLVAGRDLTWSDLYQKRSVAIVSEALARHIWRDPRNALGKRIRENLTGQWREVVGIAPDIRYSGVSRPAPTVVFWPTMAAHFRGDELSVRRTVKFVMRCNRAGSEAFAKQVRQAIWSVNPDLPVANMSTLNTVYSKSLSRTSFTLTILTIAAAMALLLGVIGIYGVIAYSVSQRTREIGIRMAIGAQTRQVTNMFLRHGISLAGIGIACGLAVSFLSMRLMSSLLFGVNAVDPVTYGIVSLVLVSATLLATYVPSRKALKIDPADALRSE